jgi:hypothetical protein
MMRFQQRRELQILALSWCDFLEFGHSMVELIIDIVESIDKTMGENVTAIHSPVGIFPASLVEISYVLHIPTTG